MIDITVSAAVDRKMQAKGYQAVKGAAKLNDVVVTETHREVLSPTLSTQKAVDIFNLEFCDSWTVYRPLENLSPAERAF